VTTKQLVLAGGGHSHALVLRLWAMHPKRRPPGLITLVNRHSTALYSGMVPGLVAGLYSPEECAIDLRRLCVLTGVSFVQAEITAVDLARQELVLAGRPPLAWDLLSLDVGAEVGGSSALPVKPLEPFLAWCHGLEATQAMSILGGGAAAVEVALALRHRGLKPSLRLRGDQLHLGSRAAKRLGETLLKAAGLPLVRNWRKEQALANASATDSNQESNPALACTGSRGPSWLEASGLPTNPAGRVLTEASLQVKGLPAVFASGDCGVIDGNPRAASGVWAVRAAPVLAVNLERWLDHSAQQGASTPSPRLKPWRPQARALQLLGDGGAISGRPRAVAFWGPFAWGPSELLWRWKQTIDQRFMEGFTGLQAMDSGNALDSGTAMACHGCGAKLAAAPLAAALEQAGLGGPAEDAAVAGVGANGKTLLQSVDGFPALEGDAWLNARLTTLHACSDLWASGAQVDSAQALVTLPQGPAAMQQQLLAQTLAGVRSVLEPIGGKLIGGHTLEERAGGGMAPGHGPLTLALTVNGSCPGSPWPKGPLHGGDVLVLVKPIGTGVLFAASMAAAPSEHCKPAWIDQALAQMQQSQAPLVDLLRAHGCRACTDITGFGLIGHLGEMLAASAASIQVSLDAPALQGMAMAGSLELLDLAYASSLAPSNARALALLDGPIQLQGPSSAALNGLLIDPQTCGPLLAALPAHQAPRAIAALHAAGFAQAAVVGNVGEVS